MPIIVFFVTVAVLSAQWLLTSTFLAHCDAVWGGRQPPHLKEFKRISMRTDKTDQSFAAFINLAAAVINSR